MSYDELRERFNDKDVIFTGATDGQARFGQGRDPREVLTVGARYTVLDVDVHSHHTLLTLVGFEGGFNSVCFEVDEDPEEPRFGIPKDLEQYMVQVPGYPKSTTENGAALIKPKGLKIIWSNGMGWEHVSVSRRSRTPSYEDMDWVKRNWWSEDACVMQLHVAAKDHINHHPYCLHLWRPMNEVIPAPPSIMVGPKD